MSVPSTSSSVIPLARAASSVIFTAGAHYFPHLANTFSSPAGDYKVLLLQRTSKSAFFPNTYVFPGGAVDAADVSFPNTCLLHDSPTQYAFSEQRSLQQLKQKDHQVTSPLAFRLAAVRELFEESGYLHGIRPLSPQLLSQFDRKAVHDNASALAAQLTATQSQLDVASTLFPLSRWITPIQEYKARRFDCIFYAGWCDEPAAMHMIQQVAHDASEHSAAVWLSPDDALSQFAAGKIMLPPPTYYMLRMMRAHSQHTMWQNMVRAIVDAPTAPGKINPSDKIFHFETVLPVLIEQPNKDKVLILPGDSAYEACIAQQTADPMHRWDEVPALGKTVRRILWRYPASYEVLQYTR